MVNDVTFRPLRPEDLHLGAIVNAVPASIVDLPEGRARNNALAKAAVILVRMEEGDIHSLPSRRSLGCDGILCYSKICTHVGCPVALYEQRTHHLLCPCHQSTFDLADSGEVVFGPAARPLPQLPITVDRRGLPGRAQRLPRTRRTELLGARMTRQRPQAPSSQAPLAGSWTSACGNAKLVKTHMRKIFPDHWSFMLGEIALYCFIVLLLTGVFLTLWFKPSMTEVVYDGTYAPLKGVEMSRGVRLDAATSPSTCAAVC